MRQALSLCVILLLLIAGCTALPPYVTHNVTALNNHDNSSVALTVEIQSEERTVLNTSKELEPGENWKILTQEEAGDYTISVSTESGVEATEEYVLPLTDSGKTSYAVIRYTDSGELDITIKWEQ